MFIIIIIDNRGLIARWCLTPFLLSLPTAAYLGQRGLTPAGLSHTTAQCHLTILGEAVLFCYADTHKIVQMMASVLRTNSSDEVLLSCISLLTALVAKFVRVVAAVVVAVAEILLPDTALIAGTTTLPRLTRPSRCITTTSTRRSSKRMCRVFFYSSCKILLFTLPCLSFFLFSLFPLLFFLPLPQID